MGTVIHLKRWIRCPLLLDANSRQIQHLHGGRNTGVILHNLLDFQAALKALSLLSDVVQLGANGSVGIIGLLHSFVLERVSLSRSHAV